MSIKAGVFESHNNVISLGSYIKTSVSSTLSTIDIVVFVKLDLFGYP